MARQSPELRQLIAELVDGKISIADVELARTLTPDERELISESRRYSNTEAALRYVRNPERFVVTDYETGAALATDLGYGEAVLVAQKHRHRTKKYSWLKSPTRTLRYPPTGRLPDGRRV
jgi:hypothetical protein